MAVTFTITSVDSTVSNPQVIGTLKASIVNIACSGTYTDEGDALAAARFGMNKIVFFQPDTGIATDGETAVVPVYDYTNSKLLMFESGASGAALGEKTASEAVPTGLSFRAIVWGY